VSTGRFTLLEGEGERRAFVNLGTPLSQLRFASGQCDFGDLEIAAGIWSRPRILGTRSGPTLPRGSKLRRVAIQPLFFQAVQCSLL